MKLNVEDIVAEGKKLKEFLNGKKTREVFEFNSEHFFLRDNKMTSDRLAREEIGKFDFKTLIFTHLTEQEIKGCFKKEYEPILFFRRTFYKDKIYGVELPCYNAMYIFKINGNYYCHNWSGADSYDRRDFINIIRNIYTPRYWFYDSGKKYMSSPLEDGTKYAVRIYFDEDFSHRFYSNEVNGIICIEMSEINEEGTFKISKMELPKLIKAFNITNLETISLLEKVLYNDGVLYPSTRYFFDTPNPYQKNYYVLNRKRLEEFNEFLSNFEKALNSEKGE